MGVPASLPRKRVQQVDRAPAGRGRLHGEAAEQQDAAASPHERQASGGGRSVAEWATLGLSSLIVAGLVGLTLYFFVTAPTDPAKVAVDLRLTELYEADGRFYVPVTIRNTGGQTAQDALVRVTLTDPAGHAETGELQVEFLAGGGSSRGVVSFGADPRQGQLAAGLVSFLEP
ncbi:MAG: hypothetical protein AB7P40_06035 [Chloroflexota bacterium]